METNKENDKRYGSNISKFIFTTMFCSISSYVIAVSITRNEYIGLGLVLAALITSVIVIAVVDKSKE